MLQMLLNDLFAWSHSLQLNKHILKGYNNMFKQIIGLKRELMFLIKKKKRKKIPKKSKKIFFIVSKVTGVEKEERCLIILTI